VNVISAKDRDLQRARLFRRLEPEFVVQPQTEGAVAVQCLVSATEGVQGEHLGAMRPLAEAIETGRRFGVRQRRAVVEFRERQVGCVEPCAEDASVIAVAKVGGPTGVRLVFEGLSADEVERLLERDTGGACGLAGRALDELVEAVEVEQDVVSCESIGLGLGDHELTSAVAARAEVPAKHRDERLQRADCILRGIVAPDELRDPVDRHAMAARGEQDLEHLLRPDPSEVTRAERPRAVHDEQRPEHADHEPCASSRALPQPFDRTLVRHRCAFPPGDGLRRGRVRSRNGRRRRARPSRV
jgi:hypothetical protein